TEKGKGKGQRPREGRALRANGVHLSGGGFWWEVVGPPSRAAVAVTALAGIAVVAAVFLTTNRGNLKSPWSLRRRKHALSPDQWRSSFTEDGKLRDGGGIEPSIRPEVWPFLLGVYDLNSSKEEREVVKNQKRKEYEKLRRKCQRVLKRGNGNFKLNEDGETSNDGDNGTVIQGSDSSNHTDVVDERENLSPKEKSGEVEYADDPSSAILEGDDSSRQENTDASAPNTVSSDSDSDSSEDSEVIQAFPSAEGKGESDSNMSSKKCTSLPRTKSHAHLFTKENFSTWQRIIRVDAIRANAEWIPYSPSQAEVSEDTANRSAEAVGLKDYDHLEPCRIFHAARLVAILEAYAVYDPEIGYCQGMSDLLSPIIAVMEKDHEAFWCFAGFMTKARHNFRLDEVGIRRQLNIVAKIIKFKDSHFYHYLEKLQAEDCFFVYRMVVVLFRRELTFEQTLCLWEVMWADQAAIRACFGKSAWSRIRQRAPPTDDLLLYAIAASVLQRRKLIIEKYSSMDEILRECNSMSGQLDRPVLPHPNPPQRRRILAGGGAFTAISTTTTGISSRQRLGWTPPARRRKSNTSSTNNNHSSSSPPQSSSSSGSGSGTGSGSGSWNHLRSVLLVVNSSSPAYCTSSSDRTRLKSPWSRRKRRRALSPRQWRSLFTADGKLRDGGVKFLKKVRSGGVDPSIRPEVWPFLLGVYDFNSSKEERDIIRTKKRKEYEKLRRQCRRLLKRSNESFKLNEDGEISCDRDNGSFIQDSDSSSCEDVVSARESLSSEERSSDVEYPRDPSTALLEGDNSARQANSDASGLNTEFSSNDASAQNTESSDSDSSEGPEVIHGPSTIDGREDNDPGVSSRHNNSPLGTKLNTNQCIIEDFATWQRIIRVDAIRANPEWIPYSPYQATVSRARAYRSAEVVGLKDYDHLEPCRIFHAARLVAILEAYALYDPEIGYCQGMSDLLSPIIAVIPEDHEAFWCFVGYMRKARHNFRLDEVGIRRQLNIVSKIIKCKDSHLYRHLEKLQAEDCFFVYRMVVVLFRRELTFEQTICLWEVMWADQTAVRAGIGKSAWSRIRQRAPPTDDLLLYAIAASVLQKRKLIIEKYSSMDEILRECNSMGGQLDVWKLLDDAHNLVVTLHDKIESSF
ncbi:hypothetical protein Tsubulata_022384, partial [Turnera subulata]